MRRHPRFAVCGPGMSGTTDDTEQARQWLSNNPESALYVLSVGKLDELQLDELIGKTVDLLHEAQQRLAAQLQDRPKPGGEALPLRVDRSCGVLPLGHYFHFGSYGELCDWIVNDRYCGQPASAHEAGGEK